jgi:hypothetical protein
VEHEGRGHMLLAVASVDEWTEYAPILDEMINSLEFTE